MGRERSGERDNSIIGGAYGYRAQRSAQDARDRAVLAGKQAEATMESSTADKGVMTGLREKAEERKDQAAGKVEQAAETLRSQASERDGIASDAANKAADKLEGTAQYLHEHDTSEMIDDLRKFVRERPMQALAGAAIGGFFLARMLP